MHLSSDKASRYSAIFTHLCTPPAKSCVYFFEKEMQLQGASQKIPLSQTVRYKKLRALAIW